MWLVGLELLPKVSFGFASSFNLLSNWIWCKGMAGLAPKIGLQLVTLANFGSMVE